MSGEDPNSFHICLWQFVFSRNQIMAQCINSFLFSERAFLVINFFLVSFGFFCIFFQIPNLKSNSDFNSAVWLNIGRWLRNAILNNIDHYPLSILFQSFPFSKKEFFSFSNTVNILLQKERENLWLNFIYMYRI